jgi:hypothetical protein
MHFSCVPSLSWQETSDEGSIPVRGRTVLLAKLAGAWETRKQSSKLSSSAADRSARVYKTQWISMKFGNGNLHKPFCLHFARLCTCTSPDVRSAVVRFVSLEPTADTMTSLDRSWERGPRASHWRNAATHMATSERPLIGAGTRHSLRRKNQKKLGART